MEYNYFKLRLVMIPGHRTMLRDRSFTVSLRLTTMNSEWSSELRKHFSLVTLLATGLCPMGVYVVMLKILSNSSFRSCLAEARVRNFQHYLVNRLAFSTSKLSDLRGDLCWNHNLSIQGIQVQKFLSFI